MRIVIARCSVEYQGRLNAHLPEAVRMLMVKADGCVAIHSDGGAYKPLNWMNSPSELIELDDRWEVKNSKGEKLVITIVEVLSDTFHDLGPDPGLSKDGVEAHLQALLAEKPWVLEEGMSLVRREYPTDIGPIDLLCTDRRGGLVAIEVKRRGDIDGVEQLSRYHEHSRWMAAWAWCGGCSSPRPLPPRRASSPRHAASMPSRSTTTVSVRPSRGRCGSSN